MLLGFLTTMNVFILGESLQKASGDVLHKLTNDNDHQYIGAWRNDAKGIRDLGKK